MDGHEPSDEELMSRVKACQDQAAFTNLVTRHKQRAYLFALKLCGDHDDAMDTSQEAFVKVFRKAGTYKDGSRFSPWLFRIVRNTAFNQQRARMRRRQVSATELLPYVADSTADTGARARQVELWQAILSLPMKLREVLVLRHQEGLDYKEMAQVLDVPLNTVATRLHLARKELGKRYDMS